MKKKIKKDKFLDNLFGSKAFIIMLLITLIIYYYFGVLKVLNVPMWVSILKMSITIIIMLLFLFWRFKLYPEYYKRIYKDKVYAIFAVVSFIVMSFVFQMVASVPFNFIVKESFKNNPVEFYDCRITDYSTRTGGRGVSVYYEFLNNDYWIKYGARTIRAIVNINEDDQLIEEELQNNYVVRLQVRKSFWNMYYVEEMNITRKRY